MHTRRSEQGNMRCDGHAGVYGAPTRIVLLLMNYEGDSVRTFAADVLVRNSSQEGGAE